jgi:hypothetical protein
VAVLEQALRRRRGVTLNGGGVEPDALRGELIDTQQGRAQSHFDRLPDFFLGQRLKHEGESVIIAIKRAHRGTQAEGQSFLVLRYPRFQVVEAVVGLRENERQPDGGELAERELCAPIAMSGKEVVKELAR